MFIGLEFELQHGGTVAVSPRTPTAGSLMPWCSHVPYHVKKGLVLGLLSRIALLSYPDAAKPAALTSTLHLLTDSAGFPLARARGWIDASRFAQLPWLVHAWRSLDEWA